MKTKHIAHLRVRILSILVAFICFAQQVIAQPITSTLTQITTDFISTENKQNFNWQTLVFPFFAAKAPNAHGPSRGIMDMIFFSTDEGGGLGEPPPDPPATPCPNGVTDKMVPVTTTNGDIIWCEECVGINAGHGNCPMTTGSTGTGSSGTGSTGDNNNNSNNDPFNWNTWGSLGWGNLGGLFTGGFLNPPANEPTGGGNYGSGAGGGSSNSNSIKVPPPTNSLTDDPNGGSSHVTYKDSIAKPTPCDNTKGDSLTKILNSIEDSAAMKDLRAEIQNRKFEVGMAIDKRPGTNFYPYKYNNAGKGRSVITETSPWSYADVHTHPDEDSLNDKNIASPSPPDIFGTLDTWSKNNKRRFQATFVISGNLPKDEFAIAIDDTLQIKLFLATHQYQNTVNESNGSWSGDDNDVTSLRHKYLEFKKMLEDDGYSTKDAHNYATLILANDLNMGIKLYKKVNGKFRKQKITTYINDEGVEHYKPQICN